MVDDVKTEDKVAWNLASGIIQEINQLLSTASQHYVRKRYFSCFDYLKAVKMRICSSLSEGELKELAKIEEDLYLLRAEASESTGFDITDKAKCSSYKFWKLIDNYNYKLMLYLKRYGYLIPPQEDSTKMHA